MTVDTDIMVMKKDLGKKLYRKKTFYTLVIEQEVLAKDRAEAGVLLSDCGVDYSQINHEITETKNGVETSMVDANYTDSGATEYVGQVAYTDDEYAESINWIMSGDPQFKYYCKLLNIEPSYIQNKIKNYGDTRITSQQKVILKPIVEKLLKSKKYQNNWFAKHVEERI